jgi:hypothetical protein
VGLLVGSAVGRGDGAAVGSAEGDWGIITRSISLPDPGVTYDGKNSRYRGTTRLKDTSPPPFSNVRDI